MFQTFTGREYMKIDIAGHYGLDKLTWQDRINWFDTNEPKLYELMPSAKEPAQFYAGVRAWEDIQAGLPTGYMISLDATSSGLQISAALTGDLSAARLCNVVDAGTRMDAYTAIYDVMLTAIDDTSKITRDQTKEAIMTSLYGSTAMPKRVFGEGALLNVFYHTMEEMAPACWELNQAFLAMWDSTAYSHDWVLPDNFHVHIKVMNSVKETVHFMNQPFDVYTKVNEPMEEGRSLAANCHHSIDGMIVREVTRRCDYDPAQLALVVNALLYPSALTDINSDAYKMCSKLWDHYTGSGYLSARILDYITPETAHIVDKQIILDLIKSLPARPFKVVSIHDCFRCHPNFGNDLRKQYNLQLAAIYQSNLLGYILSQLVHKPVVIGKLHANMLSSIEETNYALS